MHDESDQIDLEALLDEARAIVAGTSNRAPTTLHLWAAIQAADGAVGAYPPPTAFGQLRLPLATRH
ncbi:MAG TPA: hypothetical protein VES73_17145 [Lamprocystis sp. (in: g-proteobacteria)]|nr:hypothetical protein [Lamprocystis sp. (in: g-proteobacteria)]